MSAVQLQPGKKKRLKGIEERAARLPPREPPPYLDESSPFGKYRIDSWLDDNFNAGLLNGRWCVPPSVPWHKLPPTPKTGLAQVLIRYTNLLPPPEFWNKYSPDVRANRLLRLFRAAIGEAACEAVTAAYFVLVDLPTMKRHANRFFLSLAGIYPVLADLPRMEVDKIAGELAAFAQLPDPRLPSSHVSAVNDAAHLLHAACSRLYLEFPYQTLPNTNRDALPWHFIDQLAIVYEWLTAPPPPRSSIGPFVKLCAATWQDLEFKPSLDRQGKEQTDVEGWLGGLIEKHPAIRRKPSAK
jgi:hypothetical protein